ncbi:MAG: response regulator [Thiotrichales bacterium]|nr:response regulator [Thiotrichales bacterium]
MKKFNGTPAVILLVEDNLGDARLAQEALKDGKITNDLHHVRDGVEAMEFLNREGEFGNAPRPDVILLDLNMPRKDGREVLEEINDNPDLSRIPIIVLTTSQSDADIVKSYNLNANCYISKPVDFDQFVQVVQSIEHFWFSVVTLPETSSV